MKRRPRGKPFAKGHSIGLAQRFKKGEPSANPHGRPKCAEISKALRKKLSSEVSLPRKGRTFAEQLADKWIDLGLKGNAAAISAISDRCEGRPHQSLSLDDNDPFLEVAAGIHRISEHIGRPEGQENDDDDLALLVEEQKASDEN